jgi:hypothetical protein
MAKRRSAFDEFLDETITHGRERLLQNNMIDPDTSGPNMALIQPLLGPQEEPTPDEIDMLLVNSAWVATAHEARGDITRAMAWYRLGQFQWRGGKQFSSVKEDPPDIMHRDAAARNQLPAAICSDRVGDNERAKELYLWASANYSLTSDEIDYAVSNKYYQTIWQRFPKRAYALCCLENWDEALSVAEEAQRIVDMDRRAQTKESHQAPLRILPVVLALTRYHTHPSDQTRRSAQEMLHVQSVATRSHGDHILALFYLFNLRSRHPELANPSSDELLPAERISQGAEACIAWMAKGGIQLNGTPASLQLLDRYARKIYKRSQNKEDRKAILFFIGSYFGEAVRKELAGGQWKFSEDNLLKTTVDWDMGEIELHLWAFNHTHELLEKKTKKSFYALWEETEQAYTNSGLAALYAD